MTITYEGLGSISLVGQARLIDTTREMAWAEKHVRIDKNLRWVIGNYVMADQANSNGHIFPLEDLKEYSQATIPDKPLNMLHIPDKIVGHYAAAEMLYPTGEGAGDEVVTPHIEALSAFYHYYFEDVYKEVERAHKEGALFYCVDDETELLSADGWKRRSELVTGDPILTLNTETGLSEWTPLERVHVYEMNGQDVIRMEGMMHSSVTTPNHRWWVERRSHRTGRSKGEWRTTETLTQETRIPRAVPHGDFPVVPKHDDAFVELAAWFWTEGTDPGQGGVTIYQSHAKNPANCARIAASLTMLYGPESRVRDGGLWYRTEYGRMTYFHLCKEAAQPLREVGGKVPSPSFIKTLTLSQLKLWVDTSLAGDGDNAVSGQQGIKQNSLAAQRSFEMACALLGIPTNTSLCADGQWRVGIIRRSRFINPVQNAQRRVGFEIERMPYVGLVWCPQTSKGTFLARRRGTVYWTGNSMECVPNSLVCAAAGCEQEFAYAGRISETYCAHLQEPCADRQLRQPHFTGGALIIPPVRPGWKRADIKELSRLFEEAETTYEQISEAAPHLEPKQWEMVMAAIIEAGRKVPMGERKKLAGQGKAMPDKSFPIETVGDLRNAIKLAGQAKDPAAARAHIKRRAKALGAEKLIPESWR